MDAEEAFRDPSVMERDWDPAVFRVIGKDPMPFARVMA
jgi:hypothetical protein